MLRRSLFVSSLLLLAACSTPLDRCIEGAVGKLAALDRKIRIAEENIERGYAIHTATEEYEEFRICDQDEVDGGSYPCPVTRYRTVEMPVSIDIDEERRKLKALRAQRPALVTEAEAGVFQCQQQWPE